MIKHSIDWPNSRTGGKQCLCGAPWRAGDCSARRSEDADRPFSEQKPIVKVGIVAGLLLMAASIGLIIGGIVWAIGWIWS